MVSNKKPKQINNFMKGFRMEVTEKIIGKANLSSEEAKVVRCEYNLPTAGKRTRKWVKTLKKSSWTKWDALLANAEKKIKQILSTQEKKRVGN